MPIKKCQARRPNEIKESVYYFVCIVFEKKSEMDFSISDAFV